MKTIGRHIFVSILVTVLLVMGGWGYWELRNTIRLEKERLLKHQQVIVERLSFSLMYPLWNLNKTEAEKIIHNEASDEEVLAILVFDDSGTLTAGTIRERPGKEGVKTYNTGAFLHRQLLLQNQNPATREIIRKGLMFGRVTLYVNDDHLRTIIRQQTLSLVFKLLALIAALSCVQLLVLRTVVSRPLSVLKNWVLSIGSAQPLPLPATNSCEEIDVLYASFMEMAEQLTRAKEELETGNRLLRSVMDNTFQLQGLISPDGKLIYANATALQMVNSSLESLLGHDFCEAPWFTHSGELQDKLRDAIARAAQGEFVRFEATHYGFDKTLHDIDFSLKPVMDEAGNVVYLLPEGRDITEQKRNREALKESEHKYRLVADNATDIIWVADFNTQRFTFVSPSVLKLLGYSVEEALELTIPDVTPEESLNVVYQFYAKLLEKSRTDMTQNHTMQLKLKRKDGSEMWAEINTRIIYDKHNEPAVYLGITRDITERKMLDEVVENQNIELKKYQEHLEKLVEYRTEALRNSEKRLNDLIDLLPDATFAIDMNGIITVWNRTAEEFTGASAQDMIGKGNREYAIPFYGERRPILIDLVFGQCEEIMGNYPSVRIDGEIVIGESYTLNLKRGEAYVSGIAAPLYDSDGKMVGAIESIRDITDRKHTEDALKKAQEAADAANQAKSTFLANMSHEIRTPMNAILGFSQLLQNDQFLSEKHRKQIDAIIRSGEILLALINDILEISKIEVGKTTLTLSNFDLCSLIMDLEMMFETRTKQKGLSLDVQISHDTPRFIITDEGKFRQILINLLGNAVKFTKVGGVFLRIYTEVESDHIRLIGEVEDTGEGISQQETGKLFKQFEQASAGARSLGGTGLGLAISREFARLMGGDISVTSEYGKGSTFRFVISVLEGKPEVIKERHPKRYVTGIRSGLGPFRVLVVDDDETNRNILCETLDMPGFETREAINGLEAIRIFTEWHPHLILMDIRMLEVGGLEATMRIRSLETDKTVPIIAVTASAFEHEKERIFEAGFNGFIFKPFKLDELFNIIQEHLEVEYEYASTKEETLEAHSEISALTSEAILMIPEDIRKRICMAAERADIDSLINIISEVENCNDSVFRALLGLARRFDYERLLEIFG